MAFGGEAMISVSRIEEFLLVGERAQKSCISDKYNRNKGVTIGCNRNLNNCGKLKIILYLFDCLIYKNVFLEIENALELTQVSAVWDPTFPQHTLKNVTFNVKAGTLCAVVGSVGAGKV